MKDEIKEILDGLNAVIKQEGSLELDFKECKKILDYITNLQEENEYSNYCNEELRKKITNLKYKIELLEQENEELKGSEVNE